MDFSLSDEQSLLKDSVERFVQNDYDFDKRRKVMAEEEGFSRKNWQQFAELGGLAPTVSEEAVLERDPEALLAAGEPDSDALDDWQRWPRLAANRYGNRFYLPPSLTGRAGPRLPEAGRALCERLETARRHRDQS